MPVSALERPRLSMTYCSEHEDRWQKESGPSLKSALAAQSANAGDPGVYAMGKLRMCSRHDQFPLLLAAEWVNRSAC